MSAAERLKALETDVYQRRYPGVRDDAFMAIGRALPQIKAVIEAAEDFAAWPDHQSPDWPALSAALAALDEALS